MIVMANGRSPRLFAYKETIGLRFLILRHFQLVRFDVPGSRHVCGTEFQEILIELVLLKSFCVMVSII